MNLFAMADPRPIHFMGIAGAGMSGLALLARQQGVAITGCDTDPSGAAELAALGVEIWWGEGPEHVVGARALVVTAAVAGDHPELERARALGVPVVRRADALGQAVAGGLVVAVAGTHGKTTTTVMVTEALAAAGREPTGLAGGRVARWGWNARLGGSALYVVEADEYDRAFLSLAPTVAVVNNVEADHLECYGGSVAALEQAFVEFAGRARRVIAGADDAGAMRVAAALETPVWRVGLAADADVRIVTPELAERGSAARIELPNGGAGRRAPERRRWPCGTARRWWTRWRSGCGRGTWCSPSGRGTSPVWDPSCCGSWGARSSREPAADARAPQRALGHGHGGRRRRLVRRPRAAGAPRGVPRAADRAGGREEPGALRGDRRAAAAVPCQRVQRHAAARRPAARARRRGGGAGGAPAAGGAADRAARGGARGARAQRPASGRGRCAGPRVAVRPRAHRGRPAAHAARQGAGRRPREERRRAARHGAGHR